MEKILKRLEEDKVIKGSPINDPFNIYNWGSGFETVGRVVCPAQAALYTGAAWRWWFGGEEGQVAGGHKRRHPNSGDTFVINLKRDGCGLLAGADAKNTGKPIGAIFALLSPRFKIIGSKLKRDWAMEKKSMFRPTGFNSL